MPILHNLMILVLLGLPFSSPRAFDLDFLLDAKDQLEARERNVQADNVEIERGAPGAVVMLDGGFSVRHSPCLVGADCSRRPITAGNYLLVEGTAPWLVLMGYGGFVGSYGEMHEKGDIIAANVVEVSADGIRPGGLHIRSVSGGVIQQRLRR